MDEKSQALSVFSVYSNAKSLLSYEPEKSPNVIQCLHGLRALGAQWVVYGHTLELIYALPIRNGFDQMNTVSEITYWNRLFN